MSLLQKRTWAEVDLSAARNNFEAVRALAGDAKLCCVVKANAYGHGAVKLGKLYESMGADFLAVATVEEALQLRNADIQTPILVMGYTDPALAPLLSLHHISQCVFSEDYGNALAKHAEAAGVRVKIHIKFDTGMGRIGFWSRGGEDDQLEGALRICRLDALLVEGAFTHFASADGGNGSVAYTERQFEAFCRAVDHLTANGVSIPIRHCANSAALIDFPHMRLDMVRAGLVLYGLLPSDQPTHKLPLLPLLELKTIIDHIKPVKAGMSISYGREFVADRDMLVATLPIGYADGLLRANSRSLMRVEVAGAAAPIIGRICMDQCMIDITGIGGVAVGSTVTVYGHDPFNTVNRVAAANKTINYEILCSIGARVPRVYIE